MPKHELRERQVSELAKTSLQVIEALLSTVIRDDHNDEVADRHERQVVVEVCEQLLSVYATEYRVVKNAT